MTTTEYAKQSAPAEETRLDESMPGSWCGDKPEVKHVETWIVTGGANKHIKKKIELCPTLLSRMSQGYDTYGLPSVIEVVHGSG